MNTRSAGRLERPPDHLMVVDLAELPIRVRSQLIDREASEHADTHVPVSPQRHLERVAMFTSLSGRVGLDHVVSVVAAHDMRPLLEYAELRPERRVTQTSSGTVKEVLPRYAQRARLVGVVAFLEIGAALSMSPAALLNSVIRRARPSPHAMGIPPALGVVLTSTRLSYELGYEDVVARTAAIKTPGAIRTYGRSDDPPPLPQFVDLCFAMGERPGDVLDAALQVTRAVLLGGAR